MHDIHSPHRTDAPISRILHQIFWYEGEYSRIRTKISLDRRMRRFGGVRNVAVIVDAKKNPFHMSPSEPRDASLSAVGYCVPGPRHNMTEVWYGSIKEKRNEI